MLYVGSAMVRSLFGSIPELPNSKGEIMRTVEEIKKERDYLRREYVDLMNNGRMTPTKKCKLNAKIETLNFVLNEDK